MTHAKRLWSIWQALLSAFAWAFTRPSFRRFAEWITAMAINGEEHTITQSVLALERPADWKALESFAEYGAWHPDYVTASLTRLVETAPGRLWHGYHISAVDDSKVHRNSPDVWGTCTFHEYTARCPNRAPTVRAHNWVVLGALLHQPEKPAWFLPISGRLYFRQSQLPIGPDGIHPDVGPVQGRNPLGLRFLRRFRLARTVEGDRLANERLEGGLVNFFSFVDVDRAACVSVETRVEETGRILQRRALGEGKLHDILVGFASADDAVVRPNRSAHPLPLLDDVRVCFLDELAHSAEGFPAPVPEFGDSFRDELRCRLALARARLFHVLILEVPDIFHLQDSGG